MSLVRVPGSYKYGVMPCQFRDYPAAYGWLSPVQIDGDGANGQTDGIPAYVPVDSGLPHLDVVADGGHPGDWYGMAVDGNGVRYTQKEGDYVPGAYISTTSLQNHDFKPWQPDRYVDAAGIPFVALHFGWQGFQLGDVGFCFNIKTRDSVAVIFADGGNTGELGEISVAAAKKLNIPSSPINGGTDEKLLFTLMFKGSTIGFPKSYDQILQAALAKWKEFGGYTTLRANYSSIAW